MAALDPQAAVTLAAWLETTASFEDRAEELVVTSRAQRPPIERAGCFARVYLGNAEA
ncbi:hypothetical protein [Streptomyces sp. NPDC056672]|uniref:hypothetical protein n=1 Tax=Streptomyces sp. NPDC056672 TaxID=3345906 RepID=UPI0036C6CC38